MTAPNLADLRAHSEQPNDLPAIVTEFLQQCGPCDAGLPMGCACSKRDYRPTMSRLVDEVEALRKVRDDVLALADDLTREVEELRVDLPSAGASRVAHLYRTTGLSDAGDRLRAAITNHVAPDAPASEATETKG